MSASTIFFYMMSPHQAINCIIFFYLLTTGVSINVFKNTQQQFLSSANSQIFDLLPQHIFYLIFFLNLAGVPPLPGFFIKIIIFKFVLKKFKIITILMLIIGNFTIFYLYLLNVKNIQTYTKLKPIILTQKSAFWVSATILLFILALPIYNLLLLLI